jgi:hypothetical protein
MLFFYKEYLNKCDIIYNHRLKSIYKLADVRSLKIVLSLNEFIRDSQLVIKEDCFLKAYTLFYLMCFTDPFINNYITKDELNLILSVNYFNKIAQKFLFDNYFEISEDFIQNIFNKEILEKSFFLADINLMELEDSDNLSIFRSKPVSMIGPILSLNIKLIFNI